MTQHRIEVLQAVVEQKHPEEGIMGRKKEPGICMSGGQLIAAGDVIRMMDQGSLIQCRVLSCLATEDGACLASLEILDGDRKGEKISATLRAGEEKPQQMSIEP